MATARRVTSFAKSLMLGEIHEDLVFPWPRPDEEEAGRVRDPVRAFRASR